MNEKELRKQRIQANAMLELMIMQKRIGKYSDVDIAAQQKIVDSLRNYNISAPSPPEQPKPVENLPIKKEPVKVSNEVQIILNAIKAELESVDRQKNQLGNEMTKIPDHVNCQDIVQKIKDLRKKWIELNDKYWYVQTHGNLPDVTDEPKKEVVLPTEKFELNNTLLLARSRLSKYRARLKTAKTDVKKQHYTKLISQEELLIQKIEIKFADLS